MNKWLIEIARFIGFQFSGYGGTKRKRFLKVASGLLVVLFLGLFGLLYFFPRNGLLLCGAILFVSLYLLILLKLFEVKMNPFLAWVERNKRRLFSPDEISKAVERIARPSMRLEKITREVKIGDSKLGGLPDLPDSFPWPLFKEKPLSFIAQINLSSLSGRALAAPLPSSGMLFFFYDQDQSAWGFDPKDKGFFSVLFTPTEHGLTRRAAPASLPSEAQYKESAVRLNEESSYPVGENSTFSGISDDFADVCREYIEKKLGRAPRHRLLGCEEPIQGDVMLECQLVTHGLYCGDASGYNDPRAKELENGVKEWKLLLQIDSDDELNMMWGDCGRLYFCVTDSMLQERRFEDMWMVFQCA